MKDTIISDYQNDLSVSTAPDQSNDSTSEFVRGRFIRMNLVRDRIVQVWNGVDGLLDAPQEWVVYGEAFDTAVRFPTLRDVISSLTDRFMQDPPDAVIDDIHRNQRNEALATEKYLEYIKSSIHEKKVRRRVIQDMFERGKGLRGVMYYKNERFYEDDNHVLFDDICTYRIDPRHAFIDESCYTMHDKLGIEGARDFIHRRHYPYSTFKQQFEGKEGFKNLDKVTPINWYSDQWGGYTLNTSEREVQEKSPVLVVKCYEYMNQETNTYAIIANGNTIFEDTLTHAKGTPRIPVVEYNYEPRRDSVWGTTIAELLAPYIYLEDTLINLEIMNLKLTLQPILAVSGGFGFNPRKHLLQPGGVWTAGGTMNGRIQDNIQPLVSGNPNTNFYNFYNLLQSRETITTRSDLRNLDTSTDQTATQTLQQTRSFNAHNERIESINEIEAEGVLAELMIDIMRSFMSVKNEQGMYKRIPIKNFRVSQEEGGTPQFMEHSGSEDYFTLSEDMLRGDFRVRVLDKRSQISTNAEKLARLMQFLPLVANMAQVSPDVAQKINFIGLVEQALEYLDMDMKRSVKENTDDKLNMYSLVQEEIIFGHNIDCPFESRQDSLKRIDFLRNIRFKPKTFTEKPEWKEYNIATKNAWEYHFQSTLENMQKNHIVEKEEQMAQQQALQTVGQALGSMPGQNMGEQPMGQPQGRTVPTPAIQNVNPNEITKM